MTKLGSRKLNFCPKVTKMGSIIQRPFLRGLFLEGLIFDWASITVGSKFTVFALFYFVFVGNFQVQATGGLIFAEAI